MDPREFDFFFLLYFTSFQNIPLKNQEKMYFLQKMLVHELH